MQQLVVVVVLLAASGVGAYDNGLGATPPMGWNTWCTDDVCGLVDKCSSSLVRSVADSIAQDGLAQLGYGWVSLDDCWSAATRDKDGHLQPDRDRFPEGMAALASYVHKLGLKISLYVCIGTKTCRGGKPGSFGYYERDAQRLAEWGIDGVKIDNCARSDRYRDRDLYANYSRHLNATGRPMLVSLCNWGEDDVTAWGGDVGQMYRIQMDHLPFWELPTHAAGEGTGQGTLDIIEYVSTLKPSSFVRQYAWMDPDFLETLFWPTMSFVDSRTEWTFWSLWSAPLLVATDVRAVKSNPQLRYLLMNEEVIAVDQDASHTAGDLLHRDNSTKGEVWGRPLAAGDSASSSFAVVLFNPTNGKANVTVTLSLSMLPARGPCHARDLWARQPLPIPITESYSASLSAHDVLFLRLNCSSS